MKGQVTSTTVGIIAAVAFLAVALVVVYPAFRDLLVGSGEQGSCQFSLLLASLPASAGIQIPVQCKMERTTITQSDLNKYLPLAEAQVKKYHDGAFSVQDREGVDLSDGALRGFLYPESEIGHNTWAIQKIISDKMIDCADRAWRGRLPIDPRFKWELDAGQYVCILCSRIVFDEDVKKAIQGEGIRNEMSKESSVEYPIAPWLQNNNLRGKTYFDYLSEGNSPFFIEELKSAHFSVDKPQAVLFVARSETREGDLTTSATGFTTIRPYETITTDLGFDELNTIDADGIVTLAGIALSFNPFTAIPGAILTYTGISESVGITDFIDEGDVTLNKDRARCAVIIGD